MRSFEFARKVTEEGVLEEKAFENAKLPEYSTKASAGADFFAAEDTKIPSLWSALMYNMYSMFKHIFSPADFISSEDSDAANCADNIKLFKPTLVHTGIKANMEDDEVLELYNRSSNPKKGLVLANGVGVVDADYYNNSSNDGDIMFAFYNILPWSITIKAGERVGQGVFKKFLRPTEGLVVKDEERSGGFGSTGTK